MTARALILAIALIFGAAGAPWKPAVAVQPDEVLEDPQLEERARELSKRLRCLVCQNQSIDDSDAELARDLRILVRERLKAGDSDEEVLRFLVARYGDFVLLKPPIKPTTWILWFGPLAVFAAGGLAIWAVARRRTAPVDAPRPLSDAERERLKHLIDEDGGPEAERPEREDK